MAATEGPVPDAATPFANRTPSTGPDALDAMRVSGRSDGVV